VQVESRSHRYPEPVEAHPLIGAYRLVSRIGLGGAADRLASKLRVYIVGGGMRVSPRGYAAVTLLAPLVTVAVLLPILAPIVGPGRGAVIAVGLGGIVFAGLYSYPAVKYRNRGEVLDIKIINLEMFLLSAILSSPSYHEAILKLYDRRDLIGFDVELEEAAKSITLEGLDAAKALGRSASITPSRSARALFEGLRGLIESGFGIVEYIQWTLSSHYSDVEARYRAALDSLSMMMEIFMALAVLGPVLTIIGVIALYGLGSSLISIKINPKLLIAAVAFIVSPAVALWVLIAIDGIISRLRP